MTKSGKWVLIIGVILVLGFGGFVTYSVVDCLATGCNDTNDKQDASQVRAESISYAQTECYRSYKQASCSAMTIDNADYDCGFRGFCGWIVNVDDHDLDYHAGLSLVFAKSAQSRYVVDQFSEDDTPYTRNLDKIFTTMCTSYKPAAKVGCSWEYIDTTIDWYGGDNSTNNQSVGIAVSSNNRYNFNAKIDRTGRILNANITNIDDADGKILYSYKIAD